MLVACLVEMLLRCEEEHPVLMEYISKKRTPKQQLVAVVVTISIFCEAHPPFSLKHIATLLPYLKGDAGLEPAQEALVCLKVTQVLSAATMVQGASLGSR
jgi:hypothetical protein